MRFKIQGHRGARGNYPENTLIGFKYALSLGVDAIEMDVCFTKDQTPIIYHDQTINERKVSEFTIDEIKRLEVGLKKNITFPDQSNSSQSIPTLEEVFSLYKNDRGKTELNLELKYESETTELSIKEYWTKLKEAVEKIEDILPKMMITSFSKDLLKERLNFDYFSNVRTGLLIEESIDIHECLQLKKDLNLTYISPDSNLLKTKEQVDTLKKSGFTVYSWTVNLESEWQRLTEIGIDGIITDYPEKLKKWRDNHL